MQTREVQRLFVAVSVPDNVKDAMAAAQAEFRRALPGNAVRWTSRSQFHLTLKFLGNVEPESVQRLTDGLGGACADFAPLRLRAQGVGFFPNARSPRVLWAGVSDEAGRLAAVQQAVEGVVREFTAEKPEQQFAGHVTLGRAREIRRREGDLLVTAASAMRDRVFGEWLAVELELVRSELLPSGSRHTVILRIPLAGGAAA